MSVSKVGFLCELLDEIKRNDLTEEVKKFVEKMDSKIWRGRGEKEGREGGREGEEEGEGREGGREERGGREEE